MADLQTVIAAADTLSPDKLEKLYQHVVQKRQKSYWLVPSEDLSQILDIMRPVHDAAMDMTEQEINDLIDEALHEVRSERLRPTLERIGL
jgi:hypothetical protein